MKEAGLPPVGEGIYGIHGLFEIVHGDWQQRSVDVGTDTWLQVCEEKSTITSEVLDRLLRH